MQKYFFIILTVFIVGSAQAQNSLKAIIKSEQTKEPISGVSVTINSINRYVSDDNGEIFIENIADGEQKLNFSSIGYKTKTITLVFPLPNNDDLEVFLESEVEEMKEVVITSTRSSRTIRAIPTKVEFIAGEELEEKGNMKPGDIRMLLNESTGIQTQQTSATSANSSIRIQGLDGRYTQILKDGFPLYSGASSGAGLLQAPPLDLKHVGIIKE